jgi:hypothetical protein
MRGDYTDCMEYIFVGRYHYERKYKKVADTEKVGHFAYAA